METKTPKQVLERQARNIEAEMADIKAKIEQEVTHTESLRELLAQWESDLQSFQDVIKKLDN